MHGSRFKGYLAYGWPAQVALRLSPGDASARSVNPHCVVYVMVTAIRVPVWPGAHGHDGSEHGNDAGRVKPPRRPGDAAPGCAGQLAYYFLSCSMRYIEPES